MHGHSDRNSKTSIMFTLAVSFLIFGCTAFNMISRLIFSQYAAIVGADILVRTTGAYEYSEETPIPCIPNEIAVTEFLES